MAKPFRSVFILHHLLNNPLRIPAVHTLLARNPPSPIFPFLKPVSLVVLDPIVNQLLPLNSHSHPSFLNGVYHVYPEHAAAFADTPVEVHPTLEFLGAVGAGAAA